MLVATGVAPWIQRASDMKAEVVMNHDMERKLQQHSDEILKLIKDVKFKVWEYLYVILSGRQVCNKKVFYVGPITSRIYSQD